MPNYKSPIFSKLPKVGTTIFTKMSAMANKHEALNLSQGFPDFPIDPKLIDCTLKAMKSGYNQYSLSSRNRNYHNIWSYTSDIYSDCCFC